MRDQVVSSLMGLALAAGVLGGLLQGPGLWRQVQATPGRAPLEASGVVAAAEATPAAPHATATASVASVPPRGAYGWLVGLDLSAIDRPTAGESSEPLAGYPEHVQIAGHHAYVTTAGGGLHVMDIGDPGRPRLVGTSPVPGWARDVVAQGRYAYLIAGGGFPMPARVESLSEALDRGAGGLYVLDVTDPTTPTVVGYLWLPGIFWRLALAGQHVYVPCWLGGLQIVDVSQPTLPRLVATWQRETAVSAVAVAGSTAYVGEYGGEITVLDVSLPTRPRLVGSFATGTSVSDLALKHDRLYVLADDPPGRIVLVFDLSGHPVATHVRTDMASAIALGDRFVYVAGHYLGLYVIRHDDITAEPHRIAVPGRLVDVAVAGGRAFLLIGDLGPLTWESWGQ